MISDTAWWIRTELIGYIIILLLLVASGLIHSKWLELTFKSQRAVGVQNNNGLALRGRKQMSELLLVILPDEMCILSYSTSDLHSSGSSSHNYHVIVLHIIT